MHFHVIVDEVPRRVELIFGQPADVAMVSRWRAPAEFRSATAVRDSLEFARLASKRWRYYRRSIPTATSLHEFRSLIARDAQTELSFILLARAAWFGSSSVLGLAQCRRTYCNHMILEFLAVHPRILADGQLHIRGIGSALLHSLAALAGVLEIPLIWGEATALSAAFYSKALDLSGVQDHFFIRGATLENSRRKFQANLAGRIE